QGSSIADVFGDNTIRYRAKLTTGFLDLRVDFYKSFDMGHQFIGSNLREEGGSMSDELKAFLAADLAPPSDPQNSSAFTLWKRRTALYQCILKAAEYPHAANFEIEFPVGEEALAEIYKHSQKVKDAQPGATNQKDRAAATIAFFDLRAQGRGFYKATPD